MELVIEPLSIISRAILGVIEDSSSVHLVLLEFPFIVSPVFKCQLALSMLLVV